jgi:hypothetical protein
VNTDGSHQMDTVEMAPDRRRFMGALALAGAATGVGSLLGAPSARAAANGDGHHDVQYDGNQAHVVWHSKDDGKVYYRTFDGTTWSAPEELADSKEVDDIHLFTDAAGLPHVTFRDVDTGVISYHYKDKDGNWHQSNVHD